MSISKTAISLFKSLNIPKYDKDGNKIFNPVEDIPGHQFGDWNILNSSRSRGKTTNTLLLGMCWHATDGIQIQYIRQYDDMLTPSKAQDLFDVIIGGGYIEKITNGKYNNVKYWRRRWYFVKISPETGEVIDQAPDAFCVCLGINKEHDLRSTYNAPKGDFIIFDEYMRADKMYLRDEFIIFNNLLSTIIRDRTSAVIFLLGNLTDITSPYLLEMGLLETARKMQPGDFKHYDVDGVVINVFYIPTVNKKQTTKAKISKYFRAWNNSKMVGITGGKGNWALKIYPHAPRDEFKIIDRAQIECDDGYICRELRQYTNGYYIMFYPLNEPLDDRVIYTRNTDQAFSYMRRYGLGYTQTDEVICALINRHRCYYSDNVTGERVTAYIKSR